MRKTLRQAGDKGFPEKEIGLPSKESTQSRVGVILDVIVVRRTCSRIQTHSVRPVASAPAPAPADQARDPSPGRALVRSTGSSITGTNWGGLRIRALPADRRSSRSLCHERAGGCPGPTARSSPRMRHHPRLFFLLEPISTTHTLLLINESSLMVMVSADHELALRGSIVRQTVKRSAREIPASTPSPFRHPGSRPTDDATVLQGHPDRAVGDQSPGHSTGVTCFMRGRVFHGGAKCPQAVS